MNAKEKLLKEIKNAASVNTQMIKKAKNADMEKVVVVWVEGQTSHNIPLSQNLILSMALISLQFHKGWEK